MLTQIVVLYMLSTMNSPTWCKILMWIGIGLNVIRILCKTWEAGKDSSS